MAEEIGKQAYKNACFWHKWQILAKNYPFG
jgi:hypothetical protein